MVPSADYRHAVVHAIANWAAVHKEKQTKPGLVNRIPSVSRGYNENVYKGGGVPCNGVCWDWRGEVSHVTVSAGIGGEREGVTCNGVCWDFGGGRGGVTCNGVCWDWRGKVPYVTVSAGILARGGEVSHVTVSAGIGVGTGRCHM